MKYRVTFVIFLFLLGMFNVEAADSVNTIMHPTYDQLVKWMAKYEQAPKAFIDPSIKAERGSLSLLSHMQYTPSQYNQAYCGNCWAWAGTSCLAIALDVQESTLDRLSVQYINSCESSVIGKTCCEGGWLSDLADFYTSTGHCIPWGNSNAYWQDGDASMRRRAEYLLLGRMVMP